MKILVADDDAVTLRRLQGVLASDGHDVLVAEDGLTAWALYQAERPAIVVSDWMMPALDGPGLVRRIRSLEDDGYAYIVLLTSKRGTEDLVTGIEAGADDFLSKPFDPTVLRARLRAGMRIVELQRDLAARNAELRTANARMSEDLAAAAEIQHSLLPIELPRFTTVEFAWRLRPRTELAGDVLNVFPLDAGHAGFYLLDVSGHGVPAALMAVTLSRTLVADPNQSTVLMRKDHVDSRPRLAPPAEVARRLNDRFAKRSTRGQFFTLFYGVLDLRTLELRYVSAGHPGAVLVRGGDAPGLLDATGPPIGVAPSVRYVERSITLKPRERLYVYSDGLSEARNPEGANFGVEQLARTLDDDRAIPLDETLERLTNSVDEWTGKPGFEDDVSCLALEAGQQPG